MAAPHSQVRLSERERTQRSSRHRQEHSPVTTVEINKHSLEAGKGIGHGLDEISETNLEIINNYNQIWANSSNIRSIRIGPKYRTNVIGFLFCEFSS